MFNKIPFSQFISGGVVEITLEDLPHIVNFSRQYDVPDLKSKCMWVAEKLLTEENVLKELDRSVYFGTEELQEKCLALICT